MSGVHLPEFKEGDDCIVDYNFEGKPCVAKIKTVERDPSGFNHYEVTYPGSPGYDHWIRPFQQIGQLFKPDNRKMSYTVPSCVNAPRYKAGIEVICASFMNGLEYRARIEEVLSDKQGYRVHFIGWNSSLDEIVQPWQVKMRIRIPKAGDYEDLKKKHSAMRIAEKQKNAGKGTKRVASPSPAMRSAKRGRGRSVARGGGGGAQAIRARSGSAAPVLTTSSRQRARSVIPRSDPAARTLAPLSRTSSPDDKLPTYRTRRSRRSPSAMSTREATPGPGSLKKGDNWEGWHVRTRAQKRSRARSVTYSEMAEVCDFSSSLPSERVLPVYRPRVDEDMPGLEERRLDNVLTGGPPAIAPAVPSTRGPKARAKSRARKSPSPVAAQEASAKKRKEVKNSLTRTHSPGIPSTSRGRAPSRSSNKGAVADAAKKRKAASSGSQTVAKRTTRSMSRKPETSSNGVMDSPEDVHSPDRGQSLSPMDYDLDDLPSDFAIPHGPPSAADEQPQCSQKRKGSAAPASKSADMALHGEATSSVKASQMQPSVPLEEEDELDLDEITPEEYQVRACRVLAQHALLDVSDAGSVSSSTVPRVAYASTIVKYEEPQRVSLESTLGEEPVDQVIPLSSVVLTPAQSAMGNSLLGLIPQTAHTDRYNGILFSKLSLFEKIVQQAWACSRFDRVAVSSADNVSIDDLRSLLPLSIVSNRAIDSWFKLLCASSTIKHVQCASLSCSFFTQFCTSQDLTELKQVVFGLIKKTMRVKEVDEEKDEEKEVVKEVEMKIPLLFIPIRVERKEGPHWALAVADWDDRSIAFLDSRPEYTTGQKRSIFKALEAALEAVYGSAEKRRWRAKSEDCTKQLLANDGGVYVMLHAMSLAYCRAPSKYSLITALHMRAQVVYQLQANTYSEI